MADTVDDAADYRAVEFLKMHNEVATRLNDSQWMLEIRPIIFRLQVTRVCLTFFLDIDKNASKFLSVAGEIRLQQKVMYLSGSIQL